MAVSRTERIVQLVAAAFGLGVAGLVSYLVGRDAGAGIGIATFFLSWTFVALFVLLVRSIWRRLVRQESGTASDAAVAVDRTSRESGPPRRRRKRRKR